MLFFLSGLIIAEDYHAHSDFLDETRSSTPHGPVVHSEPQIPMFRRPCLRYLISPIPWVIIHCFSCLPFAVTTSFLDYFSHFGERRVQSILGYVVCSWQSVLETSSRMVGAPCCSLYPEFWLFYNKPRFRWHLIVLPWVLVSMFLHGDRT